VYGMGYGVLGWWYGLVMVGRDSYYRRGICSRAFLFIVLRSAQHPQIPRFLQIFEGIWPMPLSLLNYSALPLFAQRTCIPTSAAHSIGFCAIWVCISSSSSEFKGV